VALSIVLIGVAIFVGAPALFASVFAIVAVRRPSSTIDPALHRGTYLYAATLFVVACLCAAGLVVASARLPLVAIGVVLYIATHFQMHQLRRRERTLPMAPGPMKAENAAKLRSLARRHQRLSISSTTLIFATAPVIWSELGRGFAIAYLLLGCVTALHGALYTPRVLTGLVRDRGVEGETDARTTN
jgi:hypothetical protein